MQGAFTNFSSSICLRFFLYWTRILCLFDTATNKQFQVSLNVLVWWWANSLAWHILSASFSVRLASLQRCSLTFCTFTFKSVTKLSKVSFMYRTHIFCMLCSFVVNSNMLNHMCDHIQLELQLKSLPITGHIFCKFSTCRRSEPFYSRHPISVTRHLLLVPCYNFFSEHIKSSLNIQPCPSVYYSIQAYQTTPTT